MLERRRAHPSLTQLPAAKRLKTEESADVDEFSSLDELDGQFTPPTSRPFKNGTPHSEDEEFFLEETSRHLDHTPTELESALAPIKIDKEAIAEYEAMSAVNNTSTDLTERLQSRNWSRGQSSIYVDAFNLALETVLEDEAHLFDDSETEVFREWKVLDYDAQYLYVRLFLRKTSAWHRLSRLHYYSDVSDLSVAVEKLQSRRALPDSGADPQLDPEELSTPECLELRNSFTFADDSVADIATMAEASSLLTLEELKALGKEAKIQGKNKSELLRALQHMSQHQKGLEWAALKRSDSVRSTTSIDSASQPDLSTDDPRSNEMVDYDKVRKLHDNNRDDHFVRKILASTGPCIRLSLPALKLFERVHLVFYRSSEWSDKSLSTIILARISRLNFPQYVVSRSANIFESRSVLLEFEAAMRTQFLVDNILEFNGTPTGVGLHEVLSIFEDVYPRWKMLLQREQRKEDHDYVTGEGAYLRRFSPAHIYTRIVHKATTVLAKRKMYEREHQILTELLDQRLFHAARRGAWYQRKALLEEHYIAGFSCDASTNLDQKKRHWRRVSLKTCEEGLQDRECHVIYHYDLQKRIRKLEKALRLAKREQHDFGHTSLSKPTERSVEGVQIIKKTRSGITTPEERGKNMKTIWIDEREGGGECSVEEMCLSFYRNQGYKGYHCEGGIIRTLFGYLFYDILFLYVPNVFQTAYQTCPLDLHTDSFYPSRASEINRRLVEIANGEAERLILEVDCRERENRTCVVGLNWDFALKDLLEISSCFEGSALATICRVMAQEYRARGGGMPDLFLWDVTRKEIMFSEVKSENDRLSDTQRLWIHVLIGAGIKVELCNAVARTVETRGQ